MTSLLTGLALCYPLHLCSNSPSLDALPRRPAIASPPPFPYYMHLLGRDTASMHRCALSRARVQRARAHSRSRALSTDCLRSLVEFNDLSDRTVSLYLAPGRFARGLPLSLSLSRTALSPRLSRASPVAARHFVSRSVSSCLSSFPSVLLPSFSPTYRFLLLLNSPSLPPFLRHTFPPLSLLSVVLRRPPLSLSLSSFLCTDGNAERNGPERQCGRRRCTHRTVQRWTLMD